MSVASTNRGRFDERSTNPSANLESSEPKRKLKTEAPKPKSHLKQRRPGTPLYQNLNKQRVTRGIMIKEMRNSLSIKFEATMKQHEHIINTVSFHSEDMLEPTVEFEHSEFHTLDTFSPPKSIDDPISQFQGGDSQITDIHEVFSKGFETLGHVYANIASPYMESSIKSKTIVVESVLKERNKKTSAGMQT